MKKIIIYILVGIISFTTFAIVSKAEMLITGTVNSSDGLNVRKSASASASKLGTVSNGYTLTLVSTSVTNKSSSCTKGWYKIKYKSTTGYVCSNYVANIVSIDLSKVYNASDWSARVYASDWLSFRTSPSYSADLIQKLNYGSNLTIISKGSSGNGCATNWYKVKYINTTGYVCGSYIIQKSNVINSSSSYNSTWANAGFPSSYYPYLTYLKNKYPKATFTAVKTNTNFNDAVLSEYGSNYIQSTDSNLRASSKQAEAGGWYIAKNETIAFYLDPRNFLNEKMVFVFEDNKYTASAHTDTVVKSVFDGGKLGNHAASFVSSGANVNISPVHLATRARQEVGINGNDATAGPYYNFFNIGAYSSCSNPLLCGINYAKSKGWDTPVKSITAGANLLKSNYYNNNQKSKYYEKFNVINGKYSNQYMTNINAPVAEAAEAYSTYLEKGVLNSNWNFIIPVFNNMPNSTSFANSTTTVSSAPAPAVVVPSVPTVSGVSAKLTSSNKIKVSFKKVSGATKYKIWYKRGNGSWSKVTVKSTSRTFTGLKKGYTYYFKVKAWKKSKKSSYYSTIVSATTLKTPSIKVSKTGSKSVRVAYSQIAGATGYKVYRKTYGGSYKRICKTSATYCNSTKLKKNKRYYYKVRAYKTVGSKKIYSNYSSVKSKKL